MVPASHLRVYQPLESFPEAERSSWTDYVRLRPAPTRAFRHLVYEDDERMGALIPDDDGNALVKEVNGKWMVCPKRTRIRALGSLLTLGGSLPAGGMWVPQAEARKAAEELKGIYESDPSVRVHIASAAWHVPLRWFIAFDDSERILTEEGGRISTRKRLRYETDLGTARTRLERGFEILKEAGIPESEWARVADLIGWASGFPSESIIELDYGTLTDLIDAEELDADRSAGEIWAALEALSLGDMEESGLRYVALVRRWERIRSIEASN